MVWCLDKNLLLLFAAALLAPTGCLRNCQTPDTTAFRSVVETPWRLVESTDPQVAKNLDNFNFLIMNFARNNSGDVQRVIDNEEYGAVMSIVWVPDSSSGMMRIRYSSVADSSQIDSIDDIAPATGDMGTYDYQYDLGRDLELYELKRGYYYRYVPFKGIVDPDNNCSF